MAEGEERPSGGGDDEKGKYPVGFRFKPTPQELVEFYLLPKLQDKPTVPNDAVIEADAYDCDPEILTKKYKERGEDDNWYFLSPRIRKYPGGFRPTRRTADNRGRWKPSTGQSKPEKNAATGQSKAKKKLCVGSIEFTENTLAYHLGPANNETKTKWLMHELTVPEHQIDLDSGSGAQPSNHMLLNKYVMCKIYKSPLKKWKEVEEGSTSSASACEEVPISSRSWPAPESIGETAASTPSSKQAGKRPAVEQPRGHANGPNKRASQQTVTPGPPGSTRSNGGGGTRVPVGVGAAGYHGVPGHLSPMPWSPAIYNSLQRPPLMCNYDARTVMVPYNCQAPVQGPPALRLFPPHRVASTAPISLGRTMMMRPPNLAAGQPVRPPSVPRPPWQQQLEMNDMNAHRVYAQLIAEMKLQKAQEQRLTAATQPSFDEGVNHPAGAEAVVPRPQFPAPHDCYPCEGGQQQRQCSPEIPAARVPGGSTATPAADNTPSKLSVPGDANEGSGKGGCYNNGKQLFADLATTKN